MSIYYHSSLALSTHYSRSVQTRHNYGINYALEAIENCFRAYSGVFGLAYTWVEWFDYNIQRALGACIDEAERQMGISEVRNTVERIKYIRNIEKEIKEALNSLPIPGKI